MAKKILAALTALLLLLSACSTGDPAGSGTGTDGSQTADPGTNPPETVNWFVFDPYFATPEYGSLYGEDFLSGYKSLVDAFLAYETEFDCKNEEIYELIFTALPDIMPYFTADAYLSFDGYAPETGKGTIHYTSADKAGHDEKYETFKTKAARWITNAIQEGDGELVKAAALYKTVSSYVMRSGGENEATAYSALINERASAYGFAAVYSYLLGQAGVWANTCTGITTDGSAAHAWTVVRIDGKYYYMDTAYENGDTGGLGLSYFGMTGAERAEAGGFAAESVMVGVTGALPAKDFDTGDGRFSGLRGSEYFEIDREKSEIAYRITGDDEEKTLKYQ